MAPIGSKQTRPVRLAAEKLKAALQAPADRRAGEIRDAKEWLLSAADDHEAETARARRMFAESVNTSEPELLANDVVVSVLSDLRVANTLMAAGNALEETDEKPNPALLDQALLQLDHTVLLEEQTQLERAFAATPIQSPDLTTARETLRQQTEEALRKLVSDAKDASSAVIEAIKKVDGQKVLDALKQFGGPLAQLPKLGNLYRKGVEKLQSAMDFFTRLLDSGFADELKKKLGEIWTSLKDGSWAENLLGWAIGMDQVHAALGRATADDRLNPGDLDRASGEVEPLASSFSGQMKTAKSITSAVAFGGGLLLLAGVTAGSSALFLGGAYLTILAVILIMGRDCAGSGTLFHDNRGIRSIMENLGRS